jgi:hypothetical protein
MSSGILIAPLQHLTVIPRKLARARAERGRYCHLMTRALSLVSVLIAGCAPAALTIIPSDVRSPYTGYSSEKYRNDAMWACRPDLSGDMCHGDLSATEIHPDGKRTRLEHQPAADPKVDCFYVYPTMDDRMYPANQTDFSNLERIRSAVMAQAARFSETCAVYVPLYRQMSLGSYMWSATRRDRLLETAFSDLHDAFLHYLGQYNHGRKFVLIGHSQGADMVARLLRQVVEDDPALRPRLIVAMAIGWQFEVPRGQRVGGSFSTIPICASPDETGCLIAFRTYREGQLLLHTPFTVERGHRFVCVNPADVSGNERRPASRAYLPLTAETRGLIRGADGIDTPFLLYRDLFQLKCVDGPDGYRYLGVSLAPGVPERLSPFDLEIPRYNGPFGMHVLDMQFSQGDLIEQVARRVAALGK